MMAWKEAETRVFWDMITCSVPDGYDAGRVGPCFKRALKKLGYSGRVSITGLGILTDVSTDVLQALYSSGVSLSNLRSKATVNLQRKIYHSIKDEPPWDNLMLISSERNFVGGLGMLELNGVHVIRGLPFDHLQTASTPIEFHVWESFLLAVDSGVLEEDLEEDPGWSCGVCLSNGQGFENFSMHLKHKLHESILATQIKHSSPSNHLIQQTPTSNLTPCYLFPQDRNLVERVDHTGKQVSRKQPERSCKKQRT